MCWWNKIAATHCDSLCGAHVQRAGTQDVLHTTEGPGQPATPGQGPRAHQGGRVQVCFSCSPWWDVSWMRKLGSPLLRTQTFQRFPLLWAPHTCKFLGWKRSLSSWNYFAAIIVACVLWSICQIGWPFIFFLPAWKQCVVSANQKRAGVSTVPLSLSVRWREICLHWCHGLTLGLGSTIGSSTTGTELAWAANLSLMKGAVIWDLASLFLNFQLNIPKFG